MRQCGKNIVQADRPHKTMYYDACAFHAGYPRLQTHSPEYAILTAFPPQYWLHERASVLRYTYIVCLVDTAEHI
jgi:hypothetical protein